MYTGARIDLAHRRSDGIDVVLWWSPEDDTVAVEVLHLATDNAFEIEVERSRVCSRPSALPGRPCRGEGRRARDRRPFEAASAENAKRAAPFEAAPCSAERQAATR